MNERDEKAAKDAAKEVITNEQLRSAVKDAYKELIGDYIRTFGWWSLKTLGAMAIGGIVALALLVQARGG